MLIITSVTPRSPVGEVMRLDKVEDTRQPSWILTWRPNFQQLSPLCVDTHTHQIRSQQFVYFSRYFAHKVQTYMAAAILDIDVATQFSIAFFLMHRHTHTPDQKLVVRLFFKIFHSQGSDIYMVAAILDFDVATQFSIAFFLMPRYTHTPHQKLVLCLFFKIFRSQGSDIHGVRHTWRRPSWILTWVAPTHQIRIRSFAYACTHVRTHARTQAHTHGRRGKPQSPFRSAVRRGTKRN